MNVIQAFPNDLVNLMRSGQGWTSNEVDFARPQDCESMSLQDACERVVLMFSESDDVCVSCLNTMSSRGQGEAVKGIVKPICVPCIEDMRAKRDAPFTPEPCSFCGRMILRYELVTRDEDANTLMCALCRNRTPPLPLP